MIYLNLAAGALGVAIAITASGVQAADDPVTGNTLPSEPVNWTLGDIELSLGGFAGGAFSYSMQQGGPSRPDGYDRAQAGGELRSWLRAQRTLDNGMVFGVRTDLLIAHDPLSGDIYDNDTVERLFAFVQTGFGRLEIGQEDGAAYSLALTGPEIDPQVSLEARTISLFRNPVTGRDFGQFFKQITAVQSSSNYAKLNYVTPRLFGLQIGASITPETVRTPLPWTGNPPNKANEQHNIWEVAANYTGYFSGLAVGVYAGYAGGGERQKTMRGEDLRDWSAGAEFAYMIDGTKLTVGGAYRSMNASLFDIYEVFRGYGTEGEHVSATVERGPWRLGAETSIAHAAGSVDYRITGLQTTVAYQFTQAITLTGGWQWYEYARNSGAFYNGRPGIQMNAGYVGLSYAL
jgi:outer membrane protein OmpU